MIHCCKEFQQDCSISTQIKCTHKQFDADQFMYKQIMSGENKQYNGSEERGTGPQYGILKDDALPTQNQCLLKSNT